MTKERSIDTDEELVAALGEAIDSVEPPEGAAEVDVYLREIGHDPDEIGRNTSAFVDVLIAGVRNNAAPAREQALAEFQNRELQLELPATRTGLLEAIGKLLSRRGAEVAAQFRNLEAQTDNDLRGLLRQLTAMDEADGGGDE